MSHELRTPLNAIIGYSEMLQEEAAELGQDDLVPDLEEDPRRRPAPARPDQRHSRPLEDRGRQDGALPRGRRDRAAARRGALRSSCRWPRRTPTCSSTGWPTSRQDARRPHQAAQSLLNLLSNASKFTENGRLTLERPAFETDKPMVSFAVSDTGIGMTAGAARPALPGVHPGRRLDHQQIRRHRPRASRSPGISAR